MFVYVVFPSSLYALGRQDRTAPAGARERGEAALPVQDIVPEIDLTTALPVGDRSWMQLAGTNDGLFAVTRAGVLEELWSGGSVRKILFAAGDGNAVSDTWMIMGNQGIFVSSDLLVWEQRTGGLPYKTIKVFENGNKSFLQIVADLKDLEFNPADPRIMVTATKDQVYLSRDQGVSWAALGALPYRANGIKAVAAAFLPDLTVFLSHSIFGIYCIQPDRPGAQWTELNQGLERLETTNNPDEIADIAVRLTSSGVEIYSSQTFRRRVYRLDWERRAFDRIWLDNSPFGTVDSLGFGENNLLFLHEGSAASLNLADHSLEQRTDIVQTIHSVPHSHRLNSIAMRGNTDHGDPDILIFNELWLLGEPQPDDRLVRSADVRNRYAARDVPMQALNKEGIYLPINHTLDSSSMRRYHDVIQRAGLNMVVIDMKDDLGRLRFTPRNPAITEKGRVFNPLDIDVFLADMRARGIFTIARVVVFKDHELAARENGRFAVWCARTNAPWVGYDDRRRRTAEITPAQRNDRLNRFFPTDNPDYEIVRRYYDERWVDPYSEEVWEYITAISTELYERGFDEIQFDYIRFPTDGQNLGDARYRWRDAGMDMESAILSFLRHARRRINAPISIDIYGANGWYRTGARTGQEVELLAPWVDIISPMYYPSHFEQYFLAQPPPEQRPWRIYYHGTLRTARIARGQTIIRPWTQAFFLNVSYDRQFYGLDYVRLQVEAVRSAGNGGFIHWNNIGRYDDLPDRD